MTGLMAAMANLDDVLRTFEGQFAAFDNSYIKYLENRKENIDLINRCVLSNPISSSLRLVNLDDQFRSPMW